MTLGHRVGYCLMHPEAAEKQEGRQRPRGIPVLFLALNLRSQRDSGETVWGQETPFRQASTDPLSSCSSPGSISLSQIHQATLPL